eukprot:2707905-Prymnesium_polylepis.1
MRAAMDPSSYAPACSARNIQMTICAQCRWEVVMAGHGLSLRCPGVSHGIARVRVYVRAAVRVMSDCPCSRDERSHGGSCSATSHDHTIKSEPLVLGLLGCALGI